MAGAKKMAMKMAMKKKAFAAKRPSSACSGGGSAPRWMVHVAFGLLAVIVLVLAYQYMVRPALQSSERFSTPARLVFLHMNGCGWCVRFMPTWDAFVTKHSGSLRMAGVEVQKIEGSDPSAAKYQVRSYPTVLLVKDGKTIKFDGDRSEDGLRAFLVTNGVSLVEGFAPKRPVGGGTKILAAAKDNVRNNTGDPNVTKSLSDSSGMKKEKK